jgi:hypothetical protein
MEGYYSTGQSPQRAVVPMEKEKKKSPIINAKRLGEYLKDAAG